MKDFTKKDLKDGMVVEFSNGARCLLLNNIFVDYQYSIKLDDLESDLRFYGNSDWDINFVYKTKCKNLNDVIRKESLEPIWIREEEIEVGEEKKEVEPCKDYDREYSIQEVFEFEEGTEFVDDRNKPIKIIGGALQCFDNDEEYQEPSWEKCLLTKGWLQCKYKLKRKEKEVEFIDALDAMYDGKEVILRYEDSELKFKPVKGIVGYDIHTNHMRNGKWYVIEK